MCAAREIRKIGDRTTYLNSRQARPKDPFRICFLSKDKGRPVPKMKNNVPSEFKLNRVNLLRKSPKRSFSSPFWVFVYKNFPVKRNTIKKTVTNRNQKVNLNWVDKPNSLRPEAEIK